MRKVGLVSIVIVATLTFGLVVVLGGAGETAVYAAGMSADGVSAPLQQTDVTPTPAPGALPETGSGREVGLALFVALALLVIGAFALLVGEGRRKPHS